MSFPLQCHHVILRQRAFFDTMRALNVQIEHSLPEHGLVLDWRSSQTASLVDEVAGRKVSVRWEVSSYHETRKAMWTFTAPDEEALREAFRITREARELAKAFTHTGTLTLPDRSAFPRIGGEEIIASLQAETNTEITLSDEDSDIVILGRV